MSDILSRYSQLLKQSAPVPPTDPVINSKPHSAYMNGGQSMVLAGFNPQLREPGEDIRASWLQAAAKALESIQNSGFLSGAVETVSSATVGHGLRPSFRPDQEALEWDRSFTQKWSRKVEKAFKTWANNPLECDAGGKFTFNQQQQAIFASWLAYGEFLALFPLIKRKISKTRTKTALLPPSRLSDQTNEHENLYQGVYIDGWGLPQAYRINKRTATQGWQYDNIAARDRDGRPNVLHKFEPSIATTRGISVFAPILKVARQVDQFFDATMVKAMIQTIFAATMKTNVQGLSAFDGLMVEDDAGSATMLDAGSLAEAKGEWYEEAKIDLRKHGRVAHLFPGDELDFKESSMAADDFDRIMSWLMREIAMGLGITYDAVSGDDRGATYSSIRMGSAREWLKVMRRRENIVIPFCNAVFETWLEEQIGTGRIEYPGGIKAYMKEKEHVCRVNWTGPAKPQADDFKTARAFEVRKEIGATTLAQIHEEYGTDWDDDAYQKAAENALYEELGLPLPWSPTDLLETPGGLEAELDAPAEPGNDKRKRNSKRQKGAGRSPGDNPEPEGQIEFELEQELEESIED